MSNPIITTFINQVSLVALAPSLSYLPSALHTTYHSAAASLSSFLDSSSCPPSHLLLTTIISLSRQHTHTHLILLTTLSFLHNLHTTLRDCYRWRLRDLASISLSNAEKEIRTTEIIGRSHRISCVLGEIVEGLKNELASVSVAPPSPPESSYLGAEIQVGESPTPGAEILGKLPLDEEDTALYHLLQSELGHPVNVLVDTTQSATPTPRPSPTPTPEPSTTTATASSGRGSKAKHFTRDQNIAILRYMKINGAYAIQNHKKALQALLDDQVFADEHGNPPLLRRRVRDKLDKLRHEIVDKKVADKIERLEKDVKDEESESEGEEEGVKGKCKGKGKGKGNKKPKVVKEKTKTYLVFKDWTDGWLDENWDGKWKVQAERRLKDLEESNMQM